MEIESSRKIPIKLNTAIGFVYLNSANHHLLFLKVKILIKELKQLEKKKVKSNLDKLLNNQLQELIRIEIIANALHYAEVFASILLAMKKYRQFHKFLMEYKVREIINFYNELPKRKPQFIAKILQYPYPNKYVDKQLHNDLRNTIEQARIELEKLAKFYLSFHSFYNSYKHGFRIVTIWPDKITDRITTAYFSEPDKLASMRSINTKDHVESAVNLCDFIFKFLNNAQEIFSQRSLQKKNQFKMTLWSRRDPK